MLKIGLRYIQIDFIKQIIKKKKRKKKVHAWKSFSSSHSFYI